MGITASEWTMLSLLLDRKSPNSRISEMALSDKTFPIGGTRGYEIKNIEEMKEILNSLERKGLIKIEEVHEPSELRKDIDVLEYKKRHDELERITLSYILNKIDATEYERKFIEIFSQTQIKNMEEIIPLTLIEKYLSILRSLQFALILIDSESPFKGSSFTQVESLESMIRTNASQVLEKIYDLFFRYLQSVKKEIEEKQDKITMVYIYLYPFIKDLIKEKKNIVDEESKKKIFKQIEELEKSIEVEKEIISVLRMLNEDERKIKIHENKLHELEHKLNEIKKIREDNVEVEFVSGDIDVNWIKNELMKRFGGFGSTHYPSLDEFIEELSKLLYEEIYKKTSKSPHSHKLYISIHNVLSRNEKCEFEENHYSFKVSLTWMNDLCPVMMDSIIESEGKELTMCKNPDCFVVYHKKCLEKLLGMNIKTCMVCGFPIS